VAFPKLFWDFMFKVILIKWRRETNDASLMYIILYMFFCLFRESLGQMRAILQRGIETIRLVGHGGLDVDIIVHLARTFAYRVRK